MSTAILEKEKIKTNNLSIDFWNETNFNLEEDKIIKKELKKINTYYKKNKFVGIPVEEAYINWIKKLNFKYEL